MWRNEAARECIAKAIAIEKMVYSVTFFSFGLMIFLFFSRWPLDPDAHFLASACTPCGLDLGNVTSEMEFEDTEAKSEREEGQGINRKVPWLFSDSVSKGFTRIINGYEAPHRPWMVHLTIGGQMDKRGENQQREKGSFEKLGTCGGIISDLGWILTASA